MLQISKLDQVYLTIANITDANPLGEIEVKIEHKRYDTGQGAPLEFDDKGALKLDEELISQHIYDLFKKNMVNAGQKFAFPMFDGQVVLICLVQKITPINMKSKLTYGMLESLDAVDVVCTAKNKAQLAIQTTRANEKQVFKKNMNFQELGIGGLDAEFNEIFRRAFNSRRFPQSMIDKYGIKHVKGMLLHGPPGTGKTLIAKKIADALNCEKPKVVNGPEIFDKYVGEAEKKIRELFEPAVQEMQEKGDESGLHVIIFDEIDALCRTRSSGGGGAGSEVGDKVVN